MHLYFFGTGSTVPAISRKILKSELIEKYHWLPQDIDKIPYKILQEHLLIQKQKNIALEAKNKPKNNPQSVNRGGRRSFTREI